MKLLFDPQIRCYRDFYHGVFVSVFALRFTTLLAIMRGYGFGRMCYGLLNSKWSPGFLYTATGLPVSVYLRRTCFAQLP